LKNLFAILRAAPAPEGADAAVLAGLQASPARGSSPANRLA